MIKIEIKVNTGARRAADPTTSVRGAGTGSLGDFLEAGDTATEGDFVVEGVTEGD